MQMNVLYVLTSITNTGYKGNQVTTMLATSKTPLHVIRECHISDVLTYYTVPIKGMLIDIYNTVALNVHSIKPFINSASLEILYSTVHVASFCYSYQLLWENHTQWRLSLKTASHDNLCTGTLLDRIITAQWEGRGMTCEV